MSHRLAVIGISFLVLATVVFLILVANGVPKASIEAAWHNGAWQMFAFATLEAMVLIIIGMVKASSRRQAPGSIGTEDPEDLPQGYRSPQSEGGSYLLAGALLLMVGTSVCWGGWLL